MFYALLLGWCPVSLGLSLRVGCMFYALLLGWCPVSLGLSLCVGVYVLCSAPGVVSCLSWFVSLCWGVCFMLCSWSGFLSLLVCLSVLGCMFYALLLGWCPVSLGSVSLCWGVCFMLCSWGGPVSLGCLSVLGCMFYALLLGWCPVSLGLSLCVGVYVLCSAPGGGVLSLLVCLSVLGCMFYALLLGWCPVSLGLSLCVGVYVLCSAPEVVSCLSWFVSLCWGVCFMLCSWGVCFMLCSWGGVLSLLVCLSVLGCMFYALLLGWCPVSLGSVSLCWGVCFMLCSWGGVLSLLVCLSVLGCMFYALLLEWCPVSLGLSLCVGVYVLCSAPGVVSCLSWFVSLCWGVCFMLCSWSGGVLSLLVCLSVLGCMFYALLLGWCPVSLGSVSLCWGVCFMLCSWSGVLSLLVCLSVLGCMFYALLLGCPVSLGLSLCVGVYVLCSAPGVESCLSWSVSLCWGVCFMLCSWGGVLSLLVCLSVLGCMFYALLLRWCPVSLGLSLCVGVYVLCSTPGVVSCLSWFVSPCWVYVLCSSPGVVSCLSWFVSLCWGVCFMLCSWGGVLSLLVCLSVLGCMFYALLLEWFPVSLGLSLCVGVFVLCSAPGVVSCLSWFVSLCWGVCFMLCSWSGFLSLLVCLYALGCMFYALLQRWFPVSLCWGVCFMLCSRGGFLSLLVCLSVLGCMFYALLLGWCPLSCLSWFVSLCWSVCFMLCSWGGVMSLLVCLSVLGCMFYALLLGWCPVSLGLSLCVGVYVLCSAPGVVSCLSWFVSLCWGVCFMLCSWGGVLSLLVCLSVLGCMFYALLLEWFPVSLGLSLCVGVYVLCSAPGVVSCLSWFVSLCWGVCFMLCSRGGFLSLLACLSVLGCMFYALLQRWFPVSLG